MNQQTAKAVNISLAPIAQIQIMQYTSPRSSYIIKFKLLAKYKTDVGNKDAVVKAAYIMYMMFYIIHRLNRFIVNNILYADRKLGSVI